MSLTTVLDLKKILRIILLYNHWNPKTRRFFRTAVFNIMFIIKKISFGISVSDEQCKRIFSKGQRKIIVPLSDPIFENMHVLRHFDKFFSIQELNCPDGMIDLTKNVRVMGFDVMTNIGMLLELSTGLAEYNRHYTPKSGDTVLDCGAFHGLYALLISKKVGDIGKIYCFEPDEKNLKVLKRNLEVNHIKNVSIIEKGMWKVDGKVVFNSGYDATSSVEFDSCASTDFTKPSITVTSIPSFFVSENLYKINFVKMDIEGAEIEVVEACIDFLRDHDVNFAVASYHLRDGTETYHAVEKLFQKANYKYVTTVTNTIITYAWPRRAVL